MSMITQVLTDPDLVLDVTLERLAEGISARGRAEITVTATQTIRASVQPATPEERETLPEAERTKAALTLWTLAALDSDVRILWQGRGWRVQAVETWQDGATPYTRAVAIREDGAIQEGGT